MSCDGEPTRLDDQSDRDASEGDDGAGGGPGLGGRPGAHSAEHTLGGDKNDAEGFFGAHININILLVHIDEPAESDILVLGTEDLIPSPEVFLTN